MARMCDLRPRPHLFPSRRWTGKDIAILYKLKFERKWFLSCHLLKLLLFISFIPSAHLSTHHVSSELVFHRLHCPFHLHSSSIPFPFPSPHNSPPIPFQPPIPLKPCRYRRTMLKNIGLGKYWFSLMLFSNTYYFWVEAYMRTLIQRRL